MGYLDEYRSIAKERFNISYLRPYQELVIRQVLEAEEGNTISRLLICLPTGSGKSICFMLPSLVIQKKTIIIYPLLSLMKDQEDRFKKAGIEAITLKGGMERQEKQNALDAFIDGNASIMITNPEMLIHLIDAGKLSRIKGKLSMLIIDEAHTTILWGESFREAFLEIPRIIDYLKPQHISAYTATMDRKIEEGIIKLIFPLERPYIIHASADRENIFYHSIKSYSKLSDVASILKAKEARPAIIFSQSRYETEATRDKLSKLFEIRAYHAGMDKSRRKEIEAWFMDSESGVLAATCAYGMGVDKKSIRTIIHLSIPISAADYLQESGRAGRDGKRADSFVLYHPEEERGLSYIFKGKRCIRNELLRLMNENPEFDRCPACSACERESYIPYGRLRILKLARRHPLMPKNAITAKLSRKSITGGYGFWDKRSTDRAISDLTRNGELRLLFKKYLLITRKGKQSIKEIQRSNLYI